MGFFNSLANILAGNSSDSDEDMTIVLLDKLGDKVSHPNHATVVRARDYDPKTDNDNMMRQEWLDSQK